MDPKIKLYTAAAPNGRKVSIALEELGLPYEVISVDLAAGGQREESFLAMNPNNKIPVLDDDGQIVWESGAILFYLAEKYGGLLPEDPRARMEAIQYAFFQTGGIGPNLGRLGGELRKPEAEHNREMMEILSAEVDRLFGVLDRILADGRPYLAGEYSIGDIMHYGWLGMALELNLPLLMKHERVVAWLERIRSRPAVQRGMKIP
jgi:GST-like protein